MLFFFSDYPTPPLPSRIHSRFVFSDSSDSADHRVRRAQEQRTGKGLSVDRLARDVSSDRTRPRTGYPVRPSDGLHVVHADTATRANKTARAIDASPSYAYYRYASAVLSVLRGIALVYASLYVKTYWRAPELRKRKRARDATLYPLENHDRALSTEWLLCVGIENEKEM